MKPEAQRIAIAEACGYKWSYVHESEFGEKYQLQNLYQESGSLSPGTRWEVRYTVTDKCPEGMAQDLKLVPAYLTDLNAMHEAEEVLTSWDDPANAGHYIWKDSYGVFIGNLEEIVGSHSYHPKANSTDYKRLISATAAQRAEAFLKTLGKWEDSK